MNGNEHARAIELITQRDVEGIPESDGRWLDSHVAACPECASFKFALNDAEQAIRSVPVAASASLVGATRARVRARAAELGERQTRTFLIAISFCIGVLASGFSAYLWWRFGGFLAEWLGLPAAIVQPGVFVASTLPAVVIAVIMLAGSHPVIDRSVTLALLGEREENRR